MKFINTNDVYTKENWDSVVERCGGWNDGTVCKNINLSKCPFYSKLGGQINKSRGKRKKMVCQSGEAGIIQAIFDKIGFTNKICADLGAWDGKHLSNTYFLRKNHGFKRLLIEGCKDKKISADCQDEKLVYSLISSKNINSLLEVIDDDIIDFISIDIDGDDWWVINSMKKKARLFILEYASGLPNELPLICKEGCGTVNSWKPNGPTVSCYYGANMLAFYKLMKQKGYQFVTSLSDNAFFVLNEEFHKLGINEISEQDMINNYFNPSKYWGETHRDHQNNEWVVMES